MFKFKYSINNVNINTDYNIIDLGIIFDSKLKFDLHINSLLSECHKLLGFIFWRCKPFTDKVCWKKYTSVCFFKYVLDF